MIEVLVTPGTSVAQDDELLILESMKREIPVQTPLLARLRRWW